MTGKKKKKRRAAQILYTLTVVSGLLTLAVFFYPTISDAWNRYVAAHLISEYVWNTGEEADYTEAILAAEAYNRKLWSKGANQIAEHTRLLSQMSRIDSAESREDLAAVDEREMENESGKTRYSDLEYESLLNVLGGSMMGFLEIPSIGTALPFYHYTSEEVLTKGVGHLYGSSLPVGGSNTHAVLTGHSGLMQAKIFTDLEKVEIGDVFTVHVLGLKHRYEVDQKKVVLPEEMEDLAIHEGADEITLLTCTPYGINTHRLLVRGHRIEDEAEEVQPENAPAERIQEAASFPAAIFGMCLLVLLSGVGILFRIWRKE